jgi:hypothetical protein
MTHHVDLGAITLDVGSHEGRDNGVCLLEAVAWWAGEPHGDHPACVSPVLAAFGRELNDQLDADGRALLIPLIPLLAGSFDPARESERMFRLADAAVRAWAPAALERHGLRAQAATLRAIVPLTDSRTAAAATAVTTAVYDAACYGADADDAHDAAAAYAAAATCDAAHDAADNAASAYGTAAAAAAADAAAAGCDEVLAGVVALVGELCGAVAGAREVTS